ncbi:Octanoyltransferase [Candidatus Magnetomoraceae bacterium gMMP-15]
MGTSCNSFKRIFINIPCIDYKKAWDLQTSLVAARIDGIINTDIFLCLEHPAVFTLGRRGGIENLIVSRDFLDKSGISVIHTERGGNITFHGPGQLVVYPIFNLKAAGLGVADYVEKLEEIMIRIAGDYGVRAKRNPVNHGVWVANSKLGSVGLRVRHGICFHGFAFNVNVSLRPFKWINPCGLNNIEVTSLEQELSKKISMKLVRASAKEHIENIFNISF